MDKNKHLDPLYLESLDVMMGAFALIPALLWRDAFNSVIKKYKIFDNGGSLLLAILLTIIYVFANRCLAKLKMRVRENKQLNSA